MATKTFAEKAFRSAARLFGQRLSGSVASAFLLKKMFLSLAGAPLADSLNCYRNNNSVFLVFLERSVCNSPASTGRTDRV